MSGRALCKVQLREVVHLSSPHDWESTDISSRCMLMADGDYTAGHSFIQTERLVLQPAAPTALKVIQRKKC